jgi:hypothetical protein
MFGIEGANSAAGGCTGQTLIDQGDGTEIGDMGFGTSGAAFDTTTSQAAHNGVSRTNVQQADAYVGKDWGAGVTKTVNGVKVWGASNAGYWSATPTVVLELYGSNSAPSSSTNGTLIKTLDTFTDTAVTDARDYTGDTFDTDTAYRYHWLRINGSTTDFAYLAELEFYECT